MKLYSIYSFWKDITSKKDVLRKLSALLDFPFDLTSFSYIRKGRGFPDFAIKTNQDKSVFTGGEFIKLKSRNNYSIAPFKSIIPSGKVNLKVLLTSSNISDLQQQWQSTDEYLLEERDVYFLVRGRKDNHQKICLIHGSFFETIDAKELIHQSFIQPLVEKLSGTSDFLPVKEYVETLSINRESFNRTPNIDKASVNFKFKVTAEIKPVGNILNPKMYPQILDDTLNLAVPYLTDEEKLDRESKIRSVMGGQAMKLIKTFSIKHPLNGWFVVFQTDL